MNMCTVQYVCMYICILREAVTVQREVYQRESRRLVGACFTRYTVPTILAKSPAKSLLLIIRQREHLGQGILLFIIMWFISLEPSAAFVLLTFTLHAFSFYLSHPFICSLTLSLISSPCRDVISLCVFLPY